jgi:hypothetical protein
MGHHKRRRPKSQRAGCLLCKPWKMNGAKKSSTPLEKHSDRLRKQKADKELKDYLYDLL